MQDERVVLLGKGLYKTIPDEITIGAIPTASELEYTSAEDFDSTMINKIFPKVVEGGSKMKFSELLNIDYDWICRCLRFKSYGPYFTTNRIFCSECDRISRGDYQVDLRTVGILPLPNGFINKIKIDRDEFIDCKEDITFHLPTIQEVISLSKDSLFKREDGTDNTTLGRICYQITSIGSQTNMTPVDVKTYIQNNFSAADYEILKQEIADKSNYGLQITGTVTCPSCGSTDARYIAFQNDKFFRPTVGDIRSWKSAIRSGEWKDVFGDPTNFIR